MKPIASVLTWNGQPIPPEMIEALRDAFLRGAAWRAEGKPTDKVPLHDAYFAARVVYPSPMRPRVVPDPHDKAYRWCVRDGHVVVYDRDLVTSNVVWPTAERVALWADLYARPTEEAL